MEQKEEDPPPFWLQSTATLRRADRHRRRRNQASNLFLNTGVLVVLLLAAAVVFLAIVIPSVLSLARQVFNPSLVKRSWNSLNFILVLFAIVCGFLGRKDDDQTPVSSPMRRETGKSAELSPSPRQWYEYHQDSRMATSSFGNVDTMRRLRSSSSYPDLRQEGPLLMNENTWRFYDDTHVDKDNYQVLRSDSRLSRSRSLGVLNEDDIDAKNIEVDTFVNRAKQKHDVKDQHVLKNIEMDNSVSYQTKVLKSGESIPAMVNRPAPPSQPSYSRQPLSPPSPVSPTNYFWPPTSPPPPPPPPPPQRAHSSVPKKKHDNKRSNPTKRESISKVETPKPSPPPPPPPPGFLYQPMSPPSPTSPINYFWPPPSPPPPPPPPPRTHPSNLAKKKQENIRNTPSKRESRSKVQTQIPSPPSPPPQPRQIQGNNSEDSKKKGIVIRTLNRFPRRKRKQSRRSYEDLTEFTEPQKVAIHRSNSNPEFPPSSPPPAPPPPPPPSPPSMFHNIFSKKGKTKKKVHSISTSAPPPPPPPPTRPLPKTRIKPPATRRSAPPAKTDSFSSIDENISNGSESPLIPTPPPPPPPPPFKVPSWKYIMQGDYVKIESNNNSPRSGYSASEDEESSPSNQKNTMSSPLSCPSPDVNSKADDFIAIFRAKLTLEKMNSIKQKQGTGPSPLGSDSGRP